MTTRYLHVDISHISRGNWRGYIPELDHHVSGTSKSNVEYEAYRLVEETQGLKSFVMVVNEC